MPRDTPHSDTPHQGTPYHYVRTGFAHPQRVIPTLLLVLPLLAACVLKLSPPARTVPGFGASALALFIPILCWLSVTMKHERSRRREDSAMATDHLRDTQYFQLYQRNRLPNLIDQTWFPMLVISLINLYFTYMLIYTPKLTEGDFGNFLILGHYYGASNAAADQHVRESFNVMCFAYLGWYIWTVSTIFSRLVTMELVAATYYNILTRLLVAVFVALMFHHLEAMLSLDPNLSLAEGVGFGIGLFPDAALAFLSDKLRQLLLRSGNRSEDFPLDLIQGVSTFRKLRLSEMGLDNCENLAAANAVELFLTSNLKLVEVIDWIGQAQLLILVGCAKFAVLQANGYRTAIDLHRGCGGPALPILADLLAFKPAQLTDIIAGMEQDPSYCNLIELRAHLRMPLSPHAVPAGALQKQG